MFERPNTCRGRREKREEGGRVGGWELKDTPLPQNCMFSNIITIEKSGFKPPCRCTYLSPGTSKGPKVSLSTLVDMSLASSITATTTKKKSPRKNDEIAKVVNERSAHAIDSRILCTLDETVLPRTCFGPAPLLLAAPAKTSAILICGCY